METEIKKVKVKCSVCDSETGIEKHVADHGSALVCCQHCGSQFSPTFPDGLYIVKGEYLDISRKVEVEDGFVTVCSDERKNRFGQWNFFDVNLMVGRVDN